ncbi:MAG: hypothetical protein NFCOHLIN_00969 [Gammaproteobacteria bacterium]|nr:hypothetical protein [Gammaproteobacteria bacterium]
MRRPPVREATAAPAAEGGGSMAPFRVRAEPGPGMAAAGGDQPRYAMVTLATRRRPTCNR